MVRRRGEKREQKSGTRSPFDRFLRILAAPVLVIAALAGCAPPIAIRPPTAGEVDNVQQGRAAVALFRINASIDGKPVSLSSPGDSNNALRIYLASLDEMGAPTRVAPASFSEIAAAEGWHYLMLPPGVYYLLVLPPGVEQNPPAVAYHAASARFGRLTQYRFEPGRGGFWSPELMAYVLGDARPQDFRALPGFWFQVPKNGQVVYLGSLSVACRSGRGLFGSLIDTCSDIDVANDLPSARQSVATALRGLSVEALPLVAYGQARPGTRLAGQGAMDVVARAPAKIAAAFTGSVLAPWGVIHSTGRPRAVAVYNLMAIGFELATRAGAESRAETLRAEVQPCVDRLAAAADTIDYATRFAPALEQAVASLGGFAREGASATAGKGLRLTVAVPLIRLREAGQSNELALEFGLEVRIEAPDRGIVRYESAWYSAPELPVQSPLAPRSPLYARFVPERPIARPVSAWCSAEAAALLEKEVSAALSHIAVQVTQDLRLNSALSSGSKNGLK